MFHCSGHWCKGSGFNFPLARRFLGYTSWVRLLLEPLDLIECKCAVANRAIHPYWSANLYRNLVMIIVLMRWRGCDVVAYSSCNCLDSALAVNWNYRSNSNSAFHRILAQRLLSVLLTGTLRAYSDILTAVIGMAFTGSRIYLVSYPSLSIVKLPWVCLYDNVHCISS